MRFLIIPRHGAAAATLAVAALALVFTAPTTAHAQHTYSDLTSFNAAATTSTYYDFEGIAAAGAYSMNPTVLTVAAPGRITFSAAGYFDTTTWAFDPAYSNGNYSFNGSANVASGLSGSGHLAVTTIGLDGLYNAFAIEIGQAFQTSGTYSIGLYNDNTQIGTDFLTGTVGTSGYFYGVTSDTAFNNIRVTGVQPSSYYTLFDNARVGSAAVGNAVPEAGTLALALPALGIVGAVLVRRRNTK